MTTGQGESLPKKKPGDLLTADYINKLSAMAQRGSMAAMGDDVLENASGTFPRNRTRLTTIEGSLQGDLAVATNSLTGATTATLDVYVRDSSGNLKKQGTVTVTNRNTGVSFSANDYIKAHWVNNEWRVGSAGCDTQSAFIHVTVIGSPTGGTFDLNFTINSVEETLTFNYNDAKAAVDTELDTHSEIADGDVIVTQGPFPNATMVIGFVVNLKQMDITLPAADWSSLTGGTGVAVISSTSQRGHPN